MKVLLTKVFAVGGDVVMGGVKVGYLGCEKGMLPGGLERLLGYVFSPTNSIARFAWENPNS